MEAQAHVKKWRRQRPAPPAPVDSVPAIVLDDGDVLTTPDGEVYHVVQIPDTVSDTAASVHEPPAAYRAMAARARSYYLAHVNVGFTDDEAWSLLCMRLESEADQ